MSEIGKSVDSLIRHPVCALQKMLTDCRRQATDGDTCLVCNARLTACRPAWDMEHCATKDITVLLARK